MCDGGQFCHCIGYCHALMREIQLHIINWQIDYALLRGVCSICFNLCDKQFCIYLYDIIWTPTCPIHSFPVIWIQLQNIRTGNWSHPKHWLIKSECYHTKKWMVQEHISTKSNRLVTHIAIHNTLFLFQHIDKQLQYEKSLNDWSKFRLLPTECRLGQIFMLTNLENGSKTEHETVRVAITLGRRNWNTALEFFGKNPQQQHTCRNTQ